MKAVLAKSSERFDSFQRKLNEYNITCTILDFSEQKWIDFDYTDIDFLIFYPNFEYSAIYPLALFKVHDNLIHIHRNYPELLMYPDPGIIYYYNDKYRQYLFLRSHGFPIPPTIPLFSKDSVDSAHRELGYPMVIKNRYGAGGGAVFLIHNKRELESYYRIACFDFIHTGALRYFLGIFSKRKFIYSLLKERKMTYPFLSPPLLAQKFITTDHDLKTVVGNGQVVEGHWRYQASQDQWKVNIDGGGIGQWSRIPDDAIRISKQLAQKLNARWINLDLMPAGESFLITEFSPVWHHYAYREKSSFVYKEDYNIPFPLRISLDLERLIIESLITEMKQ
jgi:glutathione synthase/RimK-type ligase-like ATP-grasp enzyme